MRIKKRTRTVPSYIPSVGNSTRKKTEVRLITLLGERMKMIFPIMSLVMMAMVVTWFILMNRLFKILRTRHPDTYNSIGRPTLFPNNSIQNGFLAIRFLLGKRYRQIQDPELHSLCNFLNVFFWLYSLVFISVIFGLPFTEGFAKQIKPPNQAIERMR